MATGWRGKSDYLWDVSRHVGEWLVAHIDPQPGDTILDLAAGPGDTGFAAARLAGDSGGLISTDFSEQMVDVARDRAADLGIKNAEFRVMDAEKMDLPDKSVDAVLCRWGLMLMFDPQAALSESGRVLRDDGRVAFAVWGGPEQNPWITVTGMTMVQQGHTPPGDPFAPGGMFSMADHDRIRGMLIRAGFGEPKIEELDVVWTFADFDEFWGFLTKVAGAVAMLIESLSEDDAVKLKAALQEALESFRAEQGYAMPGVSICAAASKATSTS
jgi:ubiquinone/menaquinone biosynthesis C-methylase UbiE